MRTVGGLKDANQMGALGIGAGAAKSCPVSPAPPGRTFMRRLFDRAYSVRAAHHHVDISADCRRDCLPIGTAARSSFKVSGQQQPTFTSSRTLPALTALGQSTAPTGSPASGYLLSKTAVSPGWNCIQSFSPAQRGASAGSASESASTQTTRPSRPRSDPGRVAAKMSCLYSDHFST